MDAKNIEELTIEQLKKKDKDTTVLLLVCSISFTASLLGMTYSLGIAGVSMLVQKPSTLTTFGQIS